MKKIKKCGFVMIMIFLILFTGCKKEEIGRKEIQKNGKNITIIEDIKGVVDEDTIVKKIDVYEDIHELDWLDNSKILASKENKSQLINNGDGYSNLRNIYLYDLNTKKEKRITDKSQFQQYAVLSPNKKYVFYVNTFESNGIGYISDIDGNIKSKIEGPYFSELENARWVNNEEIIMPFKGSGFCIAKVDGSISKIENIEKKEDINEVIKVGNKIYYTTSIADERKMKIYDLNKNEKKLFVEDRVLGFYLSPKKDKFIIEANDYKKDNQILMLTDLEGKKRKILASGRMIYSTSWSNDGLKVAYVINSGGEEEQGLFVSDIKTNKKNQIATTYLDLESDIKWSPSNKKIMLSNSKMGKNEELMELTHIITLKK